MCKKSKPADWAAGLRAKVMETVKPRTIFATCASCADWP